LNCDIDEGARLRKLEREKLQRLQEEVRPSLEEQTRFKEELEHELKNNPVWK